MVSALGSSSQYQLPINGRLTPRYFRFPSVFVDPASFSAFVEGGPPVKSEWVVCRCDEGGGCIATVSVVADREVSCELRKRHETIQQQR